jgi:flagellar motor switch/type III secretory pathway protein FliN
MATSEQALNVSFEISAVAATLRVPSSVLAELSAGDSFEIELDEADPTILLLVNGRPFAIASVARVEDRLVATITDIVSNVDQEGYDPWLIRKLKAAKV